MIKLRIAIAAATALALNASAAGAQGIVRKTGQDVQDQNRATIDRSSRSQGVPGGRIPPGHMPPAGMCRVWIQGVPPGQQPAPTDCATARATAPANSRIVYGGDVNDRFKGDHRYDRNDRRYDPRYDRSDSRYDRRLDSIFRSRRDGGVSRRDDDDRRDDSRRSDARRAEERRREVWKAQQEREKEIAKLQRKLDKDIDKRDKKWKKGDKPDRDHDDDRNR